MRKLFFILIFLLFKAHSYALINLLQNYDFQIPNFAWSSSGNFYYGNPNLSNCFSCPGYAYTASNYSGAGGNNYFGDLMQQVVVPSNITNINFTFWYYITTQETTTQTPFDNCYIEIWNSSMSSLLWSANSLSNLNSNTNYQFASYGNLPLSMAGQTVNVRFRVVTDGALVTTFRIDDVGFLVDVGNQGCVNWVNGTPNDQELITATEYLCSNQVIPSTQNANSIDQPMYMGDACVFVTNSLFDQSATLPSDYFPILQTDIDNPSFYSQVVRRAIRAMLFLEYDDGRPPLSRDYYDLRIQTSPAETGRVLRMVYEAWKLNGNWSGYDQYSEGASGFICNLKKDDPFYGYIQDALFSGLLSNIIFNVNNCSSPYLPQYFTYRNFYKFLYRVMSNRPFPNPTGNSFYQPLNISTQNANSLADLQTGAFSNYEETSFNIPGGGFPLIFSHIYNSSQLEYPTLNKQIGPDLQLLEIRQRERLTPLGDGWTHSYNIYIQATTQLTGIDNNLIIRWGDGTAHVYNLLQHNYSTKGVYDNLVITSTNNLGNPTGVMVIKKDKTQYSFRRDDQGNIFTLQSIKDRNDNYLYFTWVKGDFQITVNGQDLTPLRLQKVTEGYSNRTLLFNYQSGTNYLTSVVDNTGRTITFNVDKFSHNLLSFSDPKGQVTNYYYGVSDTAIHSLVKIRRPKGNIIDNTYQKRKIKSTQANQYKVDISFSASYLNSGNSTQSSITVTPQAGQSYTTNYQNDWLGNTITETSNTTSKTYYYLDSQNPTLPTSITDNKTNITIQYTYDLRGNTIFSSRSAPGLNSAQYFFYNGNNDITQSKDALGNSTYYYYDNRGNLVSKVSPTGDATVYSRNNSGNVTQVTEGGVTTNIGYNNFGNVNSLQIQNTNITAQAVYDQASRVVSIQNPNGSFQGVFYDNNDNIFQTVDDNGGLNLVRHYVYDPNDNLVQIQDARGNSTYLTYDFDTDDLIQESYGPFNKQWTYNKDGTLKSRKTKNGASFNYVYFSQGSPLEGLLEDDGYATYNYNTQTKQLVNIDRAGKTTSYSYDNFGRVNQIQYNDFPNNKIQYEYDLNDNITKITYPGGKWIRYLYDAANRLTGLVDWNNQLFQEYHYLNKRLDYETHGGVSKTYYKYDNAGRLIKIINLRGIDTLSSYSATLDAAGNHLQETRKENYNNIPDDFPLHPITTYTYDAMNRLTSANGIPLQYDNDGNMVSYGSSNYLYDVNDRLLNSPSNLYDYDAMGNRRRKNNIRYVIDPLNGNNVLMETDMNGVPQVIYIYGIGLVKSFNFITNQEYYYQYDFRGSTTSMLDGFGQLANWYTYGPDGELLRKTENVPQPYTYIGKWGVQIDNDSLYFMHARYYNPKIGRFLSEDPVWHPNLYPYGEDNPIVNLDPDGRDVWDFVPVVGSTRDAINSAKKGNYGWAVFHTAMAISDVFLIKALVKGVVQGGAKLLIKDYSTWNSARKFLGGSESVATWSGEKVFAEKGQEIHHWLIPQNGWGKSIPSNIKNQMWNLLPTHSQLWHNSIEGKGPMAMKMAGRLWYGSPVWFKNGILYVIKGVGNNSK